MNIKFNLESVEIKVPEVQAEVNLKNISYEITDLNLAEYAEVLTKLPAVIIELRKAIQVPIADMPLVIPGTDKMYVPMDKDIPTAENPGF